MIESPRWLATQGKIDKCVDELKTIAKFNGSTVPECAVSLLEEKFQKPEKSYGAMSLFSHWRLAKNTLMLIICW